MIVSPCRHRSSHIRTIIKHILGVSFKINLLRPTGSLPFCGTPLASCLEEQLAICVLIVNMCLIIEPVALRCRTPLSYYACAIRYTKCGFVGT